MPVGFNWLDVVIIIFLLAAIIQGLNSGLIRSVFGIAGIAAGLTAAIKYYARGSGLLLEFISLPKFIADFLVFIFLFAAVVSTAYLVGALFATITRIRLLKAVDKAGGLASGLVIGLAVVGVCLILLTAFPLFTGFQDHIEQSSLAEPIIDRTRVVYDELSGLLALELPRLTFYPEDLSSYQNEISHVNEHSDVDFKALDGTACFVCGGPVDYLGLLNNSKGSISPKFICSQCGRTSDGCQTYEGYHVMYHQCPVILGNQGYRLDCGIWTNHSYHRPAGPCPVCGAE